MNFSFFSRSQHARPSGTPSPLTDAPLLILARACEQAGWQVRKRDAASSHQGDSLVASLPNPCDRPCSVIFFASDQGARRHGSWIERRLPLLGSAVFSRRAGQVDGPASDTAILDRLLQTMPRTLLARARVLLVATVEKPSWRSYSRREIEMLDLESPAKPLLVIEFRWAGRGPTIFLDTERPVRELARKAALDLWIPHRLKRMSWRQGDSHRVGLHGNHKDPAVDRAAFSAMAQLATEIALRWTRSQAGAAPGASLPRSSQKPG